MKALFQNNTLAVAFASALLAATLCVPALASSSNSCVGFYTTEAAPGHTKPRLKRAIKPKTIRQSSYAWNLRDELETSRGVAIPSRWRKMVDNNKSVRCHYEEKIFSRESLDGRKYVVSYHVLTPSSGKYKTTIVVQHGFAESSIYFSSITRLLLAMGFRVIGVDGANAGNTLLRTLNKHNYYLKSPSPVEDGMALAEVLRTEIPKNEHFIILPHSRGAAVSGLALATGLFDKNLIQQISFGGYDVWKVDAVVDRQVYNPFKYIPGIGDLAEYFANEMRDALRRYTNKMSASFLEGNINKYQKEKTEQQIGTELSEAVTRQILTDVTVEIANGLAGKDPSKHGYSNLPLYDSSLNLAEFDNGFGLVNPKLPYPISHLSEQVKSKTTMVFGESDNLVTQIDSAPIIKAIGKEPIVLKKDPETGVEATHFSPTDRPFDLVEIILKAYKESLTKNRSN